MLTALTAAACFGAYSKKIITCSPTERSSSGCHALVATGVSVFGDDPTKSGSFEEHAGTLDSIVRATPLVYHREHVGNGGWNFDAEYLAVRNRADGERGRGTSSACYEGSRYVCPPGPCTVLEINYLAELRHYRPAALQGVNALKGVSYCGAVFGTQMQFLADGHGYKTGDILPEPGLSRRTLHVLKGSVPDRVQAYIPMNSKMNRIPAWWYKTFTDWRTGLRSKLRTDGLPCSQRVIPRWMIPEAGTVGPGDGPTTSETKPTLAFNGEGYNPYGNAGSYDDLSATTASDPAIPGSGDADSSYPATKMKIGAAEGARMRPDEPTFASADGLSNGAAFTLCDSSVLKGLFLGVSVRHHRALAPGDRTVVGMGGDAVNLGGHPGDGGGGLFAGLNPDDAGGIYGAIRYYLDRCLGADCDLFTLLRADLSLNASAADRERAGRAMFLGQVATVIRPCEAFRVRQRRVMEATYNHWRRTHYNPGQNRAAVERGVLGCDPDNRYTTERCASVRARHEMSPGGTCVPFGSCAKHAGSCCNAFGESGTFGDTVDTWSNSYQSVHCTSIEDNEDALTESVSEAVFDRSSFSKSRKAYAHKSKKKFNAMTSSKCGALMQYDTGISADDQATTLKPSYYSYDMNRIDEQYLYKKQKVNTAQAVAIGVGAALLAAPVAAVAGIFGDKNQKTKRTYGFYDTTAVVWQESIEATCALYSNLAQFYFMLRSCTAYAVPKLLLNQADMGRDTMKTRFRDGYCHVMRAGFWNGGTPIEDDGADCKCYTPNDIAGKGWTGSDCDGCVTNKKTAHLLCTKWENETGHTKPADWPDTALTWNNALDRAIDGPFKRYMFKDETDASSVDNTILGRNPGQMSKADLITDDMDRSARATLQGYLPGNIYENRKDHGDYQYAFAGIGHAGIGERKAEVNSPAASPNVRGQTCVGHFSMANFLAIVKYGGDYQTGPTLEKGHNSRDRLQDGTSSCFGSIYHTKATTMCGWHPTRLEHLFGQPDPSFSSDSTFDLFTDPTRRSMTTILGFKHKGDSRGELWMEGSTEWSHIKENAAPNGFDLSGYVTACVAAAPSDSSAETMAHFSDDIDLDGHTNYTDAEEVCLALQAPGGCVGVQKHADPATGNTVYGCRSEADVLHRRGTPTAGCNRFYLVPCLGVETCNDLFGCEEDPAVRGGALGPHPLRGTDPSAPLGGIKYRTGANESYMLDGLAMYTANTRFSLNRAAFDDDFSDLAREDVVSLEAPGGLSYDFNFSKWMPSQESCSSDATCGTLELDPATNLSIVTGHTPGRVRLRSMIGDGLGALHRHGIRSVPRPSSREYETLFKYSWAGMLDEKEYTEGKRRYRFRHPSADPQKAPELFRHASDMGPPINITIAGATLSFYLNDAFVREMNALALDVTTPAGRAEWESQFWAYHGSTGKADGGSVTLGGFIDPTSILKAGTAATPAGTAYQQEYKSAATDAEREALLDTPPGMLDPTTDDAGWPAYQDAFEALCDLHVCDIVQAVPANHKTATSESPAGAATTAELNTPWVCVARNMSLFSRGMPTVDLSGDPDDWNNEHEYYARSVFGLLGFPAVTLERAVVAGVVRTAHALLSELAEQGFDTVDTLGELVKQLEDMCTTYIWGPVDLAGPRTFPANKAACKVDQAWVHPLLASRARSGQPLDTHGDPVTAPEAALPLFSAPVTKDPVDYTKADTSDLYDERREAIPVYDIPRSASYTNREDQASAVPCDCDDQAIVWECRLFGGEDTALVKFQNIDLGRLNVTAFEPAASYAGALGVWECGYSWEMPPMRTPKVGLYVPSKVDILEIYERDIFMGSSASTDSCDPSDTNTTFDFELCPTNATETDECVRPINRSCATRNQEESSSVGACAKEIFSTVMGPRPAKLQELLFTGGHPHPVATNTLDDLDDFEAFTALDPKEQALAKSGNDIAACYTGQDLYVYGGACLRWPFGAEHLLTVGYDDYESRALLSATVGARTTFVKNTKTYTDAHDMTGDITWQGYCELEHERRHYNREDHTLSGDGRNSRYRFCANDPMSYEERDSFCRKMGPHFVMYAWGLLLRPGANACNTATKVCLVVPGYSETGSLSGMLASSDVPVLAGYTILVSPFHREVVANYYAGRALMEVGNSYARTSARRPDKLPGAYHAPKHPLKLTRLANVSYATADAVLHAEYTEFTHMAGSPDVLAMLAIMPAISAAKAVEVFDVLVAHVEATCLVADGFQETGASRPLTRDDFMAHGSLTSVARCDTLDMTTAERRASGTYFLPVAGDRLNVQPRRWDEVFRPLAPDEAVFIDAGITVRSAASQHPVRFGAHVYKPRKGRSTCTRVVVGAPGFRLLDADFNQTGCSGLEAVRQAPLRFAGASVDGARITGRAVFANATPVVVAAVALGGDSGIIFSGNMTTMDGVTLGVDLYGEPAGGGPLVGPEAAFESYFHLGVARTEGSIAFDRARCVADTGCDNIYTTVVSQPAAYSDPAYVPMGYHCPPPIGDPPLTHVYALVGNCRVLHVGQITGIFGAGYEADVYHRNPSTVAHEYVVMGVLATVTLALLLLNVGLTLSGDRAVHRSLGLLPVVPDAILYEKFKAAEQQESMQTPAKTPVGLPMYHAGAVSRRPKPPTGPPAWRVRQSSDRKGPMWAGVGVQVEVGDKLYDIEELLTRSDWPELPAGLQAALREMRSDIVRNVAE